MIGIGQNVPLVSSVCKGADDSRRTADLANAAPALRVA
jgi:hypothetical protein